MARPEVTLDTFLEQMAATPFVDGQSDCALTIADWVMARNGCADPAHDLRGRYASPSARWKLLKGRGGLKAVIATCAARAGLDSTESPRREDIGLVVFGKRPTAAICLGVRWAAKGEGLVVQTPKRIIAAWRV